MLRRDSLETLSGLVAHGDLRLVYVIGIARSNSTVVCRLLGERLDGVVYEPAVPAAPDPLGHYARVIMNAYRKARKTRTGPVSLVVKDISLFIDESIFRFIARHAAHVVFTIRDPAGAHQSLVRQFGQEFRPLQRADAVINEPFEALWMALSFAAEVPRLARLADSAHPGYGAPWYRQAMGGWTVESWRRLGAQFAALDPARVTVLDAAEMREAPRIATEALATIAQALMPAGRTPMIEVAAHSRMYRRSKWAAEARRSTAIKPLASRDDAAPVKDFEAQICGGVAPIYRALLASPTNPLRKRTEMAPARIAAA
ncbi:MAG TPA: hypothetical protein VG757_11705 [Devosia sp.]|nr:hypothetical protein [Devosia sp.]